MYTFLAYAGIDPTQKETVNKAKEITQHLLPTLGADVVVSERSLPEIIGGWFYFRPEPVYDWPMISETDQDDYAVLAFGQVYQQKENTAAEIVCQTMREQGLETVRRLNGIFSAVIVDKKQKTLMIASDLLGQRSLRFFQHEQGLFVSSHDLPLVATGLCPLQYDYVSAASLMAFDWSLGGKPFLKSVVNCNPAIVYTWHKNHLSQSQHPVIDFSKRFQKSDRRGLSHHIDTMVESMQTSSKFFLDDVSHARIALTAGFDSRAIFALLLSVADKSQIKASTAGESKSFEVQTARQIAELYGVHYENYNYSPNIKLDDFFDHSTLLAFVSNGSTNSKNAIGSLPTHKPSDGPAFLGNGAELYRGVYYPGSFVTPPMQQLSLEGVFQRLNKIFPNNHKIIWNSTNTRDDVDNRLKRILEEYCRLTSIPSDWFDLFEYFERYGRWGDTSARLMWDVKRYMPFGCPNTLKLNAELPAPISNNYILHKTLIKRFAPETYYIPVNKYALYPFTGHSKLYSILSKSFRHIRIAQEKAVSAFSKDQNTAILNKIQGDIFSTTLADPMRDILLSSDSIWLELVDRHYLKSLLDDHIQGRCNHIHQLGFLLTLEQWRRLMIEAHRLATQR